MHTSFFYYIPFALRGRKEEICRVLTFLPAKRKKAILFKHPVSAFNHIMEGILFFATGKKERGFYSNFMKHCSILKLGNGPTIFFFFATPKRNIFQYQLVTQKKAIAYPTRALELTSNYDSSHTKNKTHSKIIR